MQAAATNFYVFTFLRRQRTQQNGRETASSSTHLRFVSQSQTSSRSAKWQKKGGAKGRDTKYFYQALDPCTVQLSLRLGYFRLTFRLGCRKHLFDLNLNVNPKYQHQPQATPSPAQPCSEQTIPKPPRRNGCWGLCLHDYGVSGAAGALSSFQHHLSCHIAGLALMHRFCTSPLGCQSPLLCGL